jgi:hypothetical protein
MTGRPRDVRHGWRIGLVVVTAALYGWIGLSAHGLDRVLGLGGAVLIVASLIVTALAAAGRSRPAAVALLLLGALPLAVTTWWSLATPLLAVLCVVLAWPRTVPARPS